MAPGKMVKRGRYQGLHNPSRTAPPLPTQSSVATFASGIFQESVRYISTGRVEVGKLFSLTTPKEIDIHYARHHIGPSRLTDQKRCGKCRKHGRPGEEFSVLAEVFQEACSAILHGSF
jgi:hypothetical protein